MGDHCLLTNCGFHHDLLALGSLLVRDGLLLFTLLCRGLDHTQSGQNPRDDAVRQVDHAHDVTKD